jgi:uncharacterized protein (DUF924 family)
MQLQLARIIVETAGSVLAFWFGAGDDDASIAKSQAPLWWRKNPELDRKMAERFRSMVELARAGTLESWKDKPQQALALILLTDQMPRNIWRGSARAFASDGIAVATCRHGLDRGYDQQLHPLERVFFYLPLEHSESMQDQEQSVSLFTALFQQAPESRIELYRGYLTYALRHRRVIERFGRFPHRNDLLGRESTWEERAFLAEPGSSF